MKIIKWKRAMIGLFDLMGRNATYRIGRAMYLHARGDIDNDMSTNGEMLIQNGVLAYWKRAATKDKKLVIFDVGANIGDWSAALLGQLKTHEIVGGIELFSFEPVSATAEVLRKNLVGNEACLNIEEIALSSSSGTAEIYLSVEENAGTNSLYDDSHGQKKPEIINLMSAADFCDLRGISHVHLLKCDTEGHDMEVIRGALSLLKEGRISVLQFEYNHRWIFAGSSLRDIFVAIEFLPYKLVKLQRNSLLVFEKWHPELDKFFEGNYGLIHIDSLIWFPVKSAEFDKFNVLITR